ncbi:MAG: NAD-dependent epimerase/dehydratase family protein [Nitrospinae bacterium]|nr:NAD-dependent epimerase/dehydratase family protein [Nitrospinota bacterium]
MKKLFSILAEDAGEIVNKIDFSEIGGKTVLITGASGLIGVYFLASLKQASKALKFKVVAVMQSPPVDVLKELLDFDGAEFLCGDLTDRRFCENLPNADFVIHAAGYGQPGRFMQNPVKVLKLNTAVTFSLLDKLNADGKFLFVSSGHVYSGLTKLPFKESDIGISNTTHPRSCYIEGKRCGEAICNAYRSRGVKAKSARLSFTYGPGARRGDTRVLYAFIEKGLKGGIDLLDGGEANRTYCYVADAVEIMWKILFLGNEPIYNVGGRSQITVGELAIKIGKKMGVPVVFPKNPKGLAGADEEAKLDMTKVALEFGKTDYISLDEGLARTIEWQKELYKAS